MNSGVESSMIGDTSSSVFRAISLFCDVTARGGIVEFYEPHPDKSLVYSSGTFSIPYCNSNIKLIPVVKEALVAASSILLAISSGDIIAVDTFPMNEKKTKYSITIREPRHPAPQVPNVVINGCSVPGTIRSTEWVFSCLSQYCGFTAWGLKVDISEPHPDKSEACFATTLSIPDDSNTKVDPVVKEAIRAMSNLLWTLSREKEQSALFVEELPVSENEERTFQITIREPWRT